MRSLIALAIFSLTPLLSVVACSSTSTPSPEADAAATTDSGAVTDAVSTDVVDAGDAAKCTLSRRFGSELCESCLRTRCCTPILACEADAACKTILDCVVACLLKPNATPCIQKCVQDTPAGKTKYDAFDACIAARPDDPVPGCAFDCSQ